MSNWSRNLEGRNVVTGSLLLSGSADIRGLGRLTEKPVAAAYNFGTKTLSLSLASGSVFTVGINGDVNTVSINDVPTTDACGFTLVLTNNVGGVPGTYAVTWAPITWPGGIAPGVGGTPASIDVISAFTPNGGTNWFGFEGGLDF